LKEPSRGYRTDKEAVKEIVGAKPETKATLQPKRREIWNLGSGIE